MATDLTLATSYAGITFTDTRSHSGPTTGANYGLIQVETGAFGVDQPSGKYTNEATGTIVGGTFTTGMGGSYRALLVNLGTIATATGIELQSGADLVNSGPIQAASYGVLGYNYFNNFFESTIVNQSGGLISSAKFGVAGVAAPLVIRNAGTISGEFGILDSGAVFNTGTILGVKAGDFQYVAFGIDSGFRRYIASLTNAGYIAATEGPGVIGGILGNVTNQATGTIAGQSGVYLEAGSYLNIQPGNYLFNNGLIIGVTDAVYLQAYGEESVVGPTHVSYVYNFGTMAGREAGIYANPNPITIFGQTTAVYAGIYNYGGTIQGATGVQLTSGYIINTGLIDGTAGTGIKLTTGGTVVAGAAGTIIGDIEFGKGANRLIIQPGAHFEASAASPQTLSTINLAGGAMELNSLNGAIGTLYAQQAEHARAITIDTGANWQFAGEDSFAALAITNDGTITAASENLIIDARIAGKGVIQLGTGTLTLDGATGRRQTLDFSGSSINLALAQPTQFHAKIAGFTFGDTIDLSNLPLSAIKNLGFSAGTLTITAQHSHFDLTFSNPTSLTADIFQSFADGAGTGITLAPAAPAPTSEIHTFPPTPTLITIQT